MSNGTMIVSVIVILLIVIALVYSYRTIFGRKDCCGGDKTSLKDRPHASVRKER